MTRPDRRLSPTSGFFQLAAVGFAVLYAAASQNNGAAYLLAFSMAGLFCVGAVQALRNLSGLGVRLVDVSHGYAPSPDDASSGFVDVRISLHNSATAARYGCLVSLPGYPADRGNEAGSTVPVLVPGEMQEVVIRVPGLPRGRHDFPAVQVSSLYPFGFSRVTRRFEIPAGEFWVYPAPVGGMPMPASDSRTTGSGGSGRGGDDFIGVRNYQEGESQRHVDWKAVSRGSPMMVKQFGGGMDRVIVLDWEKTEGHTESRLGVLTFWLLELEKEGNRYGLKLPTGETPPECGAEHLHASLRLLAAYPSERRSAGTPDSGAWGGDWKGRVRRLFSRSDSR